MSVSAIRRRRSGTILTPGASSLSASGIALSLVHGTVLNSVVGSVSLSGTTPEFAYDAYMVAGSSVLTGYMPLLIVDEIMSIPVGSTSFTEESSYMDLGINVPIGVNS